MCIRYKLLELFNERNLLIIKLQNKILAKQFSDTKYNGLLHLLQITLKLCKSKFILKNTVLLHNQKHAYMPDYSSRSYEIV